MKEEHLLISQVIADIEISKTLIQILENSKCCFNETHKSIVARLLIPRIKNVLNDINRNIIVDELFNYSYFNSEDKKILGSIHLTFELENFYKLSKLKRKIYKSSKSDSFLNCLNELNSIIDSIQSYIFEEFRVKLISPKKSFMNYKVFHFFCFWCEIHNSNRYFYGFEDFNDNCIFEKEFREKNSKEREIYVNNSIQLINNLIIQLFEGTEYKELKKILTFISDNKQKRWRVYDLIYRNFDFDLHLENHFSFIDKPCSHFIDIIDNKIHNKELLNLMLGKHSDIKIVETDGIKCKLLNIDEVHQDEQAYFLLEKLIVNSNQDSELIIMELEELENRNNSLKKCSYLLRFNIGTSISNSSYWLLFDNLLSNYSNIENYTFRHRLYEKIKSNSQFCEFKSYKISYLVYDNFIKNNGGFSSKLIQYKDLLNDFKGFSTELLCFYFFSKFIFQNKNILNYEINKKLNLGKQEVTEIDVLFESDSEIYIIQSKYILYYSEIDSIISHFNKIESYYKNKSKKNIKFILFYFYKEQFYFENSREIKKLDEKLKKISVFTHDYFKSLEKNEFLNDRIKNILLK